MGRPGHLVFEPLLNGDCLRMHRFATRSLWRKSADSGGFQPSLRNTRINQPLTMHLSPQEIVLNLEVEFRPEMTMAQIAAAIDQLETEIRTKHAEVARIFIEAKVLKSGPRTAEDAQKAERLPKNSYSANQPVLCRGWLVLG
jgi:hypothetical protein